VNRLRYRPSVPIDMIPAALVIGGFTPPVNQNLPGVPTIGTKQFTNLYGSVADDYGYRSFTMAPGGEGCQMVGRTPDDALLISPPTVQLVQDLLATVSVDVAADRAAGIFRAVISHLRLPMFGLGMRLVYRVPAPGGDGRGYMLRHFFGAGGVDLSHLGQMEGETTWAGVKFVVSPPVAPGASYTVTIEPLNADLSMIYFDVDAQLQTTLDPGALKGQVQAVEQYARQNVLRLLSEG
jgi:hypothetical protein